MVLNLKTGEVQTPQVEALGINVLLCRKVLPLGILMQGRKLLVCIVSLFKEALTLILNMKILERFNQVDQDHFLHKG